MQLLADGKGATTNLADDSPDRHYSLITHGGMVKFKTCDDFGT